MAGSFLQQLIEDLTSPSSETAGEARSRIEQLLLKAATQRSADNELKNHLNKLDSAIKALETGKMLDKVIGEIRPGGLSRVAELYGTSPARVSGWRERAPEGVDALTLLMAAWLMETMQDQSSPAKPSPARAAVALPAADAAAGLAALNMLDRGPGKEELLIPLKAAMAVHAGGLPDLGPNAVLPEIYEHSRIVFVGEAPGHAEVISGQSFSGPSGQLLFETIVEKWKKQKHGNPFVGDFGLTNVFLTPPAGGKVSEFFGPARSKETIHEFPAFTYGYLRKSQFQPLWVNADYLVRTKPCVIVALGALAAWALLGRSDISKIRGTFTEVDYGSFKARVMATYNPGYVIRNQKGRLCHFANDIEAAIGALDAGEKKERAAASIGGLHEALLRREKALKNKEQP